MVYNTGDGSSLVIKDLSKTPRSPAAEYNIVTGQNSKQHGQASDVINKTLSSTKAFRKSQVDITGNVLSQSKVTPQSKLRYPQNLNHKSALIDDNKSYLAIGAHTMLKKYKG